MNILSKVSEILKVNEINQPIIYKPFTEGCNLDKMVKLYKINKNKELKKDIRFLKQGLQGEKDVYFELKNSDIPMVILHDVRLDFNAYVAQYDYCLITSKNIYVLEVKNLAGNLNIKKGGEFVRTINEKIIGMFSPISQNKRHLTVMEKVFEKNFISVKCPIKSLVVLTNPKTVISFEEGVPTEYVEQICRLDQLIEKIKGHEKISSVKNSEILMKRIGNLLLTNNKPMLFNLQKKYPNKKKFNNRIVKDVSKIKPKGSKKYVKKEDIDVSQIISFNKKVIGTKTIEKCTNETFRNEKYRYNKKKSSWKNYYKTKKENIVEPIKALSREELTELIKTFRVNKSKEENKKLYFIFSNVQMEELIDKKPKNKQELLNVKGFGAVKVDKYGDEILRILTVNKKESL